MNKNLLFVGAAVLGIAGAVGLFVVSGPSSSTEDAGKEQAAVEAQVKESTRKGPMEVKKGAIRKSKDDEEANPNPFAAEAQLKIGNDFGQFISEAGPAWQAVAMGLGDEGKDDLSKECRSKSSELRKMRRKQEIPQSEVQAGQLELLAKVKAAQPGEETVGYIQHLEGLLEGFEPSDE